MSVMPRAFAVLIFVLLGVQNAPGADLSPVGRWWTISSKTNAVTGVVEITQSGDELVGKVVKLIPQPGDPVDPVCKKCDGPEKGQHVLGMTILKGFKRDGDEWDGGTILDPRTGNVYSSEMHVDPGGEKLFLRGYIGISLLGRTETWLREK